MLDMENFSILAHGYTAERLANEMGVTVQTARNWFAGRTPVPLAVKRLLKILRWGDLEALGGPEWAGFFINRDSTLTLPLFHRPIPPRRIAIMFFLEPEQRARDLEAAFLEIARLKTELEKKGGALAPTSNNQLVCWEMPYRKIRNLPIFFFAPVPQDAIVKPDVLARR